MLGVDANVDAKTLKRAYLRAAKANPPERDPAGFKRVRTAFEVLSSRNLVALRDADAPHARSEPDDDPPPADDEDLSGNEQRTVVPPPQRDPGALSESATGDVEPTAMWLLGDWLRQRTLPARTRSDILRALEVLDRDLGTSAPGEAPDLTRARAQGDLLAQANILPTLVARESARWPEAVDLGLELIWRGDSAAALRLWHALPRADADFATCFPTGDDRARYRAFAGLLGARDLIHHGILRHLAAAALDDAWLPVLRHEIDSLPEVERAGVEACILRASGTPAYLYAACRPRKRWAGFRHHLKEVVALVVIAGIIASALLDERKPRIQQTPLNLPPVHVRAPAAPPGSAPVCHVP